MSTVASNQIFKDLRGQTNDPCKKADLPPASKGVSDNGYARRIIFTTTIRDSSTASGKLGKSERTSSEGGYRDIENVPSLVAGLPRARRQIPPERTSSSIANPRQGRKPLLQISFRPETQTRVAVL